MFMNPALLALSFMLTRQDTAIVTVAPAFDTLLPSYAPTAENLSLLDGTRAELPMVPEVLSSADPGVTTGDSGRRRRAIEYSDGYYTRLKIHRLASYLTLPLFAGQYLTGKALWNNPHSHGLARDLHGPLAAGIAGLFAVNTVTGVWNLWEGRKEPKGRARRWVHGLSMLVADAGFVVVGSTTPEHEDRFGGGTSTPFSQQPGARLHRDLAIGSMSLALGSYLMMLLWKD
jgi:hypothetical protein